MLSVGLLSLLPLLVDATSLGAIVPVQTVAYGSVGIFSAALWFFASGSLTTTVVDARNDFIVSAFLSLDEVVDEVLLWGWRLLSLRS